MYVHDAVLSKQTLVSHTFYCCDRRERNVPEYIANKSNSIDIEGKMEQT